jgi:LysR family transcriptional regulator, cys regulon transcriptional activator
MNLKQLKYVVEIVRHGNRLSSAAEALNTSQPGVSRQIQLLEQELGISVFQRTRNRIIGLTDPGTLVFETASRIVNDINSLKRLTNDIKSDTSGTLTIATTHAQARYILPKVIAKFVENYPRVEIALKQGNPEDICTMVNVGEADIGICGDTLKSYPDLVKLSCYAVSRSVVAKIGHPILSVRRITLATIAQYPIVTYDARYSGRWRVMEAFKQAGIEPKVILSATDADVSKTYIELGLGIGVISTITFDPKRDKALRARPADHLFEPSTIYVCMRRNLHLRKYMMDFIRAVAPQLSQSAIKKARAEPLSRA